MSDLNSSPESRIRPVGQHFECATRRSDRGATWISARGELDITSAPRFGTTVEDALSSALVVIVDLRELTFIDSAGLHLAIEADARARRSGRRLVFVRGASHVDRLFQLLGLARRLQIIDLRPKLASAPAPAAENPSDAA